MNCSLPEIPTFVTALKRRPERLQKTLAHFKERGLPPPYVVYGVDGAALNIGTFPLKEREMGCNIRSNVFGCLTSHRIIWLLALRFKLPYVLVCEDDVVFTENVINKFNLWKKELPEDWDMLYMGGWHHYLHSKPIVQYSEHVQKYNPVGTWAYIVKYDFLGTLLDVTAREMVDVDVIIAKKLADKNIYVFHPRLITFRNPDTDPMWISQTTHENERDDQIQVRFPTL
jgi:GR25 family glycosyltransferase involved in LPS biosynthesis